MSHADLRFLTATALAGCIRAGALSAREVMEACLAQIARVNPSHYAIVTLLPDRRVPIGVARPRLRCAAGPRLLAGDAVPAVPAGAGVPGSVGGRHGPGSTRGREGDRR